MNWEKMQLPILTIVILTMSTFFLFGCDFVSTADPDTDSYDGEYEFKYQLSCDYRYNEVANTGSIDDAIIFYLRRDVYYVDLDSLGRDIVHITNARIEWNNQILDSANSRSAYVFYDNSNLAGDSAEIIITVNNKKIARNIFIPESIDFEGIPEDFTLSTDDNITISYPGTEEILYSSLRIFDLLTSEPLVFSQIGSDLAFYWYVPDESIKNLKLEIYTSWHSNDESHWPPNDLFIQQRATFTQNYYLTVD